MRLYLSVKFSAPGSLVFPRFLGASPMVVKEKTVCGDMIGRLDIHAKNIKVVAYDWKQRRKSFSRFSCVY